MLDNVKKGKIGERIAIKYLKSKGFTILTKNFKTALGEIDIIALDGDYLVFVEVKYRMNEDFGRPSEAINHYKIRKINQVASQYILKQRLFHSNARFDVIEIISESNELNHIENAFDSYLRY